MVPSRHSCCYELEVSLLTDRAILILSHIGERAKAKIWCDKLPDGTRVLFYGPKRTLPQNDKLWACLGDVSKQATLSEVQYTPDRWKVIFMNALDGETEFLPKLEGGGFVPFQTSSSEMSKNEMADLITLILQWGDEHGIKWKEGSKYD